MRTIRLSDQVDLSVITMGDSKRGVPEHEQETFRVMDRYRELGGNTFDSARIYDDGGADRALGKWMRSRGVRREAVRIVTKGNHPPLSDMFASRLSKEEIERDLTESLSFIGIECSDLHMLHRDDVQKPVEEIMPALDGLVKAGKTRAIGVSNWTVTRIIEANEFAHANGLEPIRACQMHFSLAQLTAMGGKDLTYCPMNDIEMGWYKESRLPVMCFGAHARGWFAATAAGKAPREELARYYGVLPENQRRAVRLQRLAGKLGKSVAAVCTAYVRDSGLNAVVLSSFTKISQLEEAMEAETFALTPEQIKYLETGADSKDR